MEVLLWSSWPPRSPPVTGWMHGHKGVACRLWVLQELYAHTSCKEIWHKSKLKINIQVVLFELLLLFLSSCCSTQVRPEKVWICCSFVHVLNSSHLFPDEPAVSVYTWTAADPGAVLWEWDDQSEQSLLPAHTAVCSGGQTWLQRGPGKMS